MNEVSHHAMTMALDFLRNDATVTVDGLISTATKIREFLDGAANEAAPAEDAPKARRRTAAKTTGETETGTASEPAPSDKPTLVAADEGNAPAAGAETLESSAAESPASASLAPTEPAVDRDTAMAAAIKLSQVAGDDALIRALKEVGAVTEDGTPRFSVMPADDYPKFMTIVERITAEEAAKKAAKSALS